MLLRTNFGNVPLLKEPRSSHSQDANKNQNSTKSTQSIDIPNITNQASQSILIRKHESLSTNATKSTQSIDIPNITNQTSQNIPTRKNKSLSTNVSNSTQSINVSNIANQAPESIDSHINMNTNSFTPETPLNQIRPNIITALRSPTTVPARTIVIADMSCVPRNDGPMLCPQTILSPHTILTKSVVQVKNNTFLTTIINMGENDEHIGYDHINLSEFH